MLIFLILLSVYKSRAQDIIKLYPNEIPNSKITALKEPINPTLGIISQVINPSLQVFLPEKAKSTGTAILICPGGSYKVLVYDGEGVNTAKQLASKGITAFVLKYRLPTDEVTFTEGSRSQLIKFQQLYNQLFNKIIININDAE